MSALTDADDAELDAWCGQKIIEMAQEAATPDTFDRVVGLAMREALKVTWRSSGLMRRPIGYARLMWVSLRTLSPVSFADVVSLLRDADVKDNMMLTSTWRLLNVEPARPTSPGLEKPGSDTTGTEPAQQ